jgi:hypothetical protein
VAPLQGRDKRVVFVVKYDDGRSANLGVAPRSVSLGDAIFAEIARRRQRAGDLPPGRIIGVKRAA